MQKRTNSPSNPVKEEQSRIISPSRIQASNTSDEVSPSFGSVPAKSWHKPDKHRKKEVHAILYTCIHARKYQLRVLLYTLCLETKFAGKCAKAV